MLVGDRARRFHGSVRRAGPRRLLRLVDAASGLHGDRVAGGQVVRRRRAGVTAGGGARGLRESSRDAGTHVRHRPWERARRRPRGAGGRGRPLHALASSRRSARRAAARRATRLGQRWRTRFRSSSSAGTARVDHGGWRWMRSRSRRASARSRPRHCCFIRRAESTPSCRCCASGPAGVRPVCRRGVPEVRRGPAACQRRRRPLAGVLDAEPAPVRRIHRVSSTRWPLLRGHGRPQVDVHPGSFVEGRRAGGVRRALVGLDEPAVTELRRAGCCMTWAGSRCRAGSGTSRVRDPW